MLKQYIIIFITIFIGLIWKLFSLNRLDYKLVISALLISTIISIIYICLTSLGFKNIFPHLININNIRNQ
jgi:hypothetical protein